jgi:hypothetical protein
MLCSGSDVVRAGAPGVTWWTIGVAVAAGEVAGPRADAGMETAASGMTWATAAFTASRCASAADTVAATELTSVNRLMPVAWTSLSSVSSADWLPATAAALALAAGVPAMAWPNWFFRTTMTGRSTFRESCAASVGGRDPKAGGSVAATAVPAVAAIAVAGTPPSTTDAAADPARTDKNLRFDMFFRPPDSGTAWPRPVRRYRNSPGIVVRLLKDTRWSRCLSGILFELVIAIYYSRITPSRPGVLSCC